MRMHVETLLAMTPDVLALAATASADGHGNVQRLVEEFVEGTNRFDRPGEILLAAYAGDILVGVGGLNVDPYAADTAVGRVRRLFIAPPYRKSGVARALMEQIEAVARSHFERIQLFTGTVEADRFYRAVGYRQVTDLGPKVSHEKVFAVGTGV